MEVKSHVQMPKGLMKAFSHSTKDGKCVYYLDLKDMEIKEAKINELGTIKGLYDPKSEEILDHFYESPFFQATLNLKKFSSGQLEALVFTRDDEEAFDKFIKSLIVRSDLMRESTRSAPFSSMLRPNVFNALLIATLPATLPRIEFFNGFRFNCLINNSDLSLVAPRNCIILYIVENTYECLLPLSPRVAIVYQREERYRAAFNGNGDPCYYFVDKGEEDIIQSINIAACENESFFNNEFLIGAGREELEILKSDLSGEQQ